RAGDRLAVLRDDAGNRIWAGRNRECPARRITGITRHRWSAGDRGRTAARHERNSGRENQWVEQGHTSTQPGSVEDTFKHALRGRRTSASTSLARPAVPGLRWPPAHF